MIDFQNSVNKLWLSLILSSGARRTRWRTVYVRMITEPRVSYLILHVHRQVFSEVQQRWMNPLRIDSNHNTVKLLSDLRALYPGIHTSLSSFFYKLDIDMAFASVSSGMNQRPHSFFSFYLMKSETQVPIGITGALAVWQHLMCQENFTFKKPSWYGKWKGEFFPLAEYCKLW